MVEAVVVTFELAGALSLDVTADGHLVGFHRTGGGAEPIVERASGKP